MQLEIVPLIVGGVLALIGLGLVVDAWTPDDVIVKRERRRRPRTERSRGGEAWIGLGTISMAAAFIGRDTWRYSVVAVMVGTALVVIGALMNRKYFGERLSHRGSLRRRDSNTPVASDETRGRK